MKEKIREFYAVIAKSGVSFLAAWAAARGINVGLETQAGLEVALVGLAVGFTNWVLNLAAAWLRQVPQLTRVVDYAWPVPSYDPTEIKAG